MTKDPKRLEAFAARLEISTEEAKRRIENVKNRFTNMSGDDIVGLLEQWETLCGERPEI